MIRDVRLFIVKIDVVFSDMSVVCRFPNVFPEDVCDLTP